MLPFSEYLTEKTLHAYDMDDTLFHAPHNAARIRVKNQSGQIIKALKPQEFNTHVLPQGHTYDFKEFHSVARFAKSARPIKPMMAHLQRMTRRPNTDTKIITARPDLDDKRAFGRFLRTNGIDYMKTHVHRVGQPNLGPTKTAAAKQKVLSDLIRKNGYKEVNFYDDSAANLAALKRLRPRHPGVRFNGYLVKHDAKGGARVHKYL